MSDRSATARKTAIVTGGASGIGKAMALGLVGAGYTVLVVDRNPATLATMPAAAAGLSGSVITMEADLSQPDSFDRIVAEALKPTGRIDVLLNVAGVGQAAVAQPLHERQKRHAENGKVVAVDAIEELRAEPFKLVAAHAFEGRIANRVEIVLKERLGEVPHP